MHIAVYPITAECTFFLVTHKTVTKIDHFLDHEKVLIV